MSAFKQSGVSTQFDGGPAQGADRLKQLRIRCRRRGTREMDLILGRFIDAAGNTLDNGSMAALDLLLQENDHDIYAWFSDQTPVPQRHSAMIAQIRAAIPVNL